MKIISKFLGTLAVLALVVPMSTYAAFGRGNSGEDKGLKSGGMFCENIEKISSKITEDMSSKSEKFEGKKETRFGHIDERRGARDNKRIQNRSEIDVKRDVKVDALLAKADTDAERAAVAKFEATLNDAAAKRRASVDAAVKTFRAGVDEILNGKFGNLDSAIATFKTKINQAISDAKADCAKGTDDQTAKESFMADVKAAREELKTGRTGEIKAQIQALAEARKTSVQNAINSFKTTMEEARNDLKEAFGENN